MRPILQADMSQDAVNYLFAFAPMVLLLAVLAATFLGTRGGHATAPSAPVKTFACASCGRRGKREHMVPVTREGAVVWYCERCAH